MNRRMIAALAIAAGLALPGAPIWAGAPELTDAVAEQIRTLLTGQGYEVGKIKIEDGLYEAYARKDGEKFEIFLDQSLAIVRTEKDD
jgi:hypothetical protein